MSPFPPQSGFSELPASQRQLPESEIATQWLTKYDSPLQAQFRAFSFCRYLIESKHESQKPKVNVTVEETRPSDSNRVVLPRRAGQIVFTRP
jgi:hypothetical protein